jgi:hypothetical protein
MDILDSFKTIMQCAIFCKSPVGNTFIINNADEKYIEYLLSKRPHLKEFITENSDKRCIIKYLGNEVIFNY